MNWTVDWVSVLVGVTGLALWQGVGLVIALILDNRKAHDQAELLIPMLLWPVVPVVRLWYRVRRR